VNKQKFVSVVLATLGGEFLKLTLEHLNKSSIRPHEILICIPEPEMHMLDLVLPDNVRIIKSPKRGQVAQRAYGLGLVSCEYVMQIDDDVFLDSDGIERLIDALENVGHQCVVSPLFKDCLSGEYLTRYHNNLKGILKSLLSTLIGGASWGQQRMGRIDKAGIAYSVDRSHCVKDSPVLVEWIPGGCALTRRADLVVDDYFPFKGKAYCEDLIHSLLWRQRGVRLYTIPSVAVCTHLYTSPLLPDEIRADFEARKYVVSMMAGSFFRCRLWYIWTLFREKIRSNLKQ